MNSLTPSPLRITNPDAARGGSGDGFFREKVQLLSPRCRICGALLVDRPEDGCTRFECLPGPEKFELSPIGPWTLAFIISGWLAAVIELATWLARR